MEQLCSISPGACLAGMYLSCAALAFWTVPLEVGLWDSKLEFPEIPLNWFRRVKGNDSIEPDLLSPCARAGVSVMDTMN